MSLRSSLGALLAVACVVLVALPYLREPETAKDLLDEPGELDRRRLELAEARDRALGALKELEFDHRTGKVSDEDYRTLVGPLRREAAGALRALEPQARTTPRVKARAARVETAMEPLEPQIPNPVPSPIRRRVRPSLPGRRSSQSRIRRLTRAIRPEPAIVPEPFPQ